MRHTLIRRFTAETHRLRRKDADGDDPDDRSVLCHPRQHSLPRLTHPQHPQEQRATPRQEDPGILEPVTAVHPPQPNPHPAPGTPAPPTILGQQSFPPPVSSEQPLTKPAPPFPFLSSRLRRPSLHRRRPITTSHRGKYLVSFSF